MKDSRQITPAKAEALAGARLDKRKSYALIDGDVCSLCKWSQPCTGCSCCNEYPCSCCTERGGGCQECGYTGRSRTEMWLPICESDKLPARPGD